MKILNRTIVVLFACLAVSAHAAVPSYQLLDLGELPGGDDWSVASDINDAGVVVGHSFVAAGLRPFIWDAAGGMRVLFDAGTSVSGQSINNSGTVVGYIAGNPSGFVYQTSSQSIKYNPYEISDVNDRGQFISVQPNPGSRDGVGYLSSADGSNRVNLKGSYGSSLPLALNESGQVVGSVGTLQGGSDAVIWDSQGSFISLGAMTDQFNWFSQAVAINESGTVAGYRVTDNNKAGAFIWSEGTGIVDLGSVSNSGSPYGGQRATDINDRGEVVGTYGFDQSFYWSQDTGMVRLGSLIESDYPYIYSLSAMSINNVGQIAGFARIGSTFHAVLLTPTPGVPEPSSAAMALAGILVTLTTLRRRAIRRPQ